MRTQLFQSARVRSRMALDPRTKLFLLLAINIMMVGGNDALSTGYIRLLLAAVPFLLLLAGGKGRMAVSYAVLYIATQCAQTYLYSAVTGAPGILVRMFSELMLRFVPGTMFGYYMLSTTRVSEFIAAMERIHLTQKLTIPLSVMFRFFPTVLEESLAIGDAMRMRGVGIRSLAKNPAAMLEYRMVPLMMSIVKIGNELSAAALTRGLGGPVKRTNICRIGFGMWDVAFGGIVTAALGIYILF